LQELNTVKSKGQEPMQSYQCTGSSDLAHVRLLKLENSRLLELANNYQSQVLELESKLSQTSNIFILPLDILLAKEKRKGSDITYHKDNPKVCYKSQL
jgi:hypothetical protein